METGNTKYINQLVNAHKVSTLIIPLIEAVEINKRARGVDKLSLPDLLKQVIDSGGEIYQELLDSDEQLLETGLISDKLFLTLAKALRNSIVLYNNPSLALFKDEISDMFESNIDFIQRYQNRTSKDVNERTKSSRESMRERQEAIGYASGAISQMFMPIWVFHTNLYTSGFISEEKITDLNRQTSLYLVKVLDTLIGRVESTQGDYSEHFSPSTIFICSEMIANVVHDFNKKLIKNREQLESYIEDPGLVLSKLVPSLYANFSVLNESTNQVLSHLFNNK